MHHQWNAATFVGHNDIIYAQAYTSAYIILVSTSSLSSNILLAWIIYLFLSGSNPKTPRSLPKFITLFVKDYSSFDQGLM